MPPASPFLRPSCSSSLKDLRGYHVAAWHARALPETRFTPRAVCHCTLIHAPHPNKAWVSTHACAAVPLPNRDKYTSEGEKQQAGHSIYASPTSSLCWCYLLAAGSHWALGSLHAAGAHRCPCTHVFAQACVLLFLKRVHQSSFTQSITEYGLASTPCKKVEASKCASLSGSARARTAKGCRGTPLGSEGRHTNGHKAGHYRAGCRCACA